MSMRETDRAWLAGILEGEACFDWNDATKRYPRIRIEMKDEDVIKRVQKLCGGGARVIPHNRSNPRHSTTYSFQVADRKVVKKVLLAIYPWMGYRRKKAIDVFLDIL